MKKLVSLILGGVVCIATMNKPARRKIPQVINYNNQHYYYAPAQKSSCSGGCGGKCGGHCHEH